MKLVLLAFGLFIALSLFVLVVHRLMTDSRVNRIWRSLDVRGPGELFSHAMLDSLPPVARRYLAHAIAVGTPLAATAELKLTGEFAASPGRWLPMRCDYLISNMGFAWRAVVGSGPVFLRANDYFHPGEGRVDVRLWGLVPIVQSRGLDVTRASRGRAALERVLMPALLLPRWGVTWQDLDSITTRASFTLDGEPQALDLTVDDAGRLRELRAPRWGNTGPSGEFEWLTFGGHFDGDTTIAGYTLPARFGVGWHYGSADYNEFFRAEVAHAVFR